MGNRSSIGYGWQPFTTTLQRIIDSSTPGSAHHGTLILRLPDFEKFFCLFGYARAAQVVDAVMQSVRSAVRGEDRVFLLGSHEFGLILPDLVSPSLLELAAHKISRAVVKTVEDLLGSSALPTRIGAAVFPYHGVDADTLLRATNTAVFEATREKRPLVMAQGDRPQTRHKLFRLAEDLVHAFNHDQFRLFLQPQLDLPSNQVKSAETLIRWEHHQDGLLLPACFLPLAEELDLMEPLTEWVVQNALRILADILNVIEDFTLSINIPPAIIVDPAFGELLTHVAELWNIESSRITLEITEDVMLSDPARALEALERLRGQGFRISIDDFGTGFSSLSYFSKLGIDELKIDRSFVTDLGTIRRNAAVVRSVVDLARNFGIHTVAEGVEDSAALKYLAELGVTRIQGFLLSKPISESKFLDFLKQRISPGNA